MTITIHCTDGDIFGYNDIIIDIFIDLGYYAKKNTENSWVLIWDIFMYFLLIKLRNFHRFQWNLAAYVCRFLRGWFRWQNSLFVSLKHMFTIMIIKSKSNNFSIYMHRHWFDASFIGFVYHNTLTRTFTSFASIKFINKKKRVYYRPICFHFVLLYRVNKKFVFISICIICLGRTIQILLACVWISVIAKGIAHDELLIVSTGQQQQQQ